MDQVVFTASKRVDLGSRNASRLRRSGRIPAVMYGNSGAALSVDLDALDFAKGIRGISESTIVKLNVDGVNHEAFVKDTQVDIISNKFLHVDFYEVQNDKLVRARVPVYVIGTAVGTREGGIMEVPLHELEVECFPKSLPEKIEVDVSALKPNQSIHVRDIKLSSDIRVLTSGDHVVALVKFAKAEVVEDAAEVVPAAGVAPVAAPAAAAAAPKA
ncbi:50S ribosomal protein L25 [Treponema sp.]